MIIVILPAYNEEGGIGLLLEKIAGFMQRHGLPYRTIVVNDGSSDGTGEVLDRYASRMPIEVITHPYNRGLGETARDAFEAAIKGCARDDIIVRLDADDTQDPAYIAQMIAKMKEGYEVVIASRFTRGSKQVGVNLVRQAFSVGAMVLMKIFFPIRGVWDYSCGFRAYSAGLVSDAIGIFKNDFISIKGLGFTGTVEKLIKLRMFKPRICEIPFTLRYDQKKSESKIFSRLTMLGYVVLIFKYFYPWGKEIRRQQKAIAAMRNFMQ